MTLSKIINSSWIVKSGFLFEDYLRMAITFNDFLIVGNPLDNFRVLLDLILDFVNCLLLLVETFGFNLAFGFKSGHNVLVFPAYIM